MDIVRRTQLTEQERQALQNESELMSLMINGTISDQENINEDTEEIEIEYIENNTIEVEESVAKDLIQLRDGSFVEASSEYEFVSHRNYWVSRYEYYYVSYNNRYEDIHRIVEAYIDSEDTVSVADDTKNLIKIVEEGEVVYYFINTEVALSNGFAIINGVWQRRKYNKIDIESLSFYKEFKESIDKFYPGNWWLQNTSETFDLNCQTRRTYYSELDFFNAPLVLIIKFPEINITNADKINHTIKDLYVGITINTQGKLLRGPFGFRSKLTNIEKHNKYHHSHLPNNNDFSINTFCLGSGPLVELKGKLYRDYNIIDYEIFFATLSIYVGWESIEGGPHRRIDQLLVKRSIDNYSIENNGKKIISEAIANNEVNINLTFDKINNNFSLDFNLLEDSITELALNFPTIYKQFCYKDTELNQYFKLNNNIEPLESEYIKPLCTLGNKKVFLEIENIVSSENTNFKKVVHPNITEYAKKYILFRVYDYYIDKEQN
jgi:hypothetical protein